MQHPRRRISLGLALGLVLAMVIAIPVAAAPRHSRLTRGDAEAIFQARTTANQIQTAHGSNVSAVRQGFLRGRISPFASGKMFCSADWLVLLISEGAGSTHRESVDLRARTGISFTIDGQPVVTQATPLKRFLTVPPSGDFWGWTVGRIYQPGAFADGDHTLVTTTTFDGSVIEVFETSFATGSGPDFCG